MVEFTWTTEALTKHFVGMASESTVVPDPWPWLAPVGPNMKHV